MEKLVHNFLQYMEDNKKRSVRTVRNYDLYLRRFLGWLKENGGTDPEKITVEKIKKYQTWLKKIKNPIKKINLKENTQNYHLIAIRKFLRFLSAKNFNALPYAKVNLPRLKRTRIDFLDQKEAQALLESPNRAEQSPLIQCRDRAILEMLYCTGLKVSELAELKKDTIDLKKAFFFIDGKGDERRIFISNQAKFWVKQYLIKRKEKNNYLFISHDRAGRKRQPGGLTARSIERIVERYAKAAGIEKRVTPQMLRHTFALGLIRGGASAETVQSKLGHSSLTVTNEYFDQ